jgi:hypothetical protein
MNCETNLIPDDADDRGLLPACWTTLDRIHLMLDGDLPPGELTADPHPATCQTCRERVAAARVLLAALAAPAEPVSVPSVFADGVFAGVWADRRARLRRVFAAGGFALAAAVLLAVWVFRSPPRPDQEARQPEMVQQTPAPAPPPVRIEAELAKAGGALRETSRAITEPAASGTRVFASLANVIVPPDTHPVPPDLDPAAAVLAELPEAARHGLGPVTGSTRKAFTRLLKDVGAVGTGGKPKS